MPRTECPEMEERGGTSATEHAIDVSMEELWELAFGDGSVVELIAKTYGLHELLHDVELETEAAPVFGAEAALDPEEPGCVIRLTTGAYSALHQRFAAAVQTLSNKVDAPWRALGWGELDFANLEDFADYLTLVSLDFIVMHELAHVSRGHVERYHAETGMSIAEVSRSASPPALSDLRRQALELDADSTAIYLFVTLSDLLLIGTRLSRAKNLALMVGTLSFCIRLVFGILSESNPLEDSKQSGTSLRDLHRGLRHPHPSIRESFAHIRVRQLASPGRERRSCDRGIKKSQEAFLAVAGGGEFPSHVLEAHLYGQDQVLEYTNALIDEIAAAAREGWMDDGSRIDRSMRLVDGLLSTPESGD